MKIARIVHLRLSTMRIRSRSCRPSSAGSPKEVGTAMSVARAWRRERASAVRGSCRGSWPELGFMIGRGSRLPPEWVHRVEDVAQDRVAEEDALGRALDHDEVLVHHRG